MVAVTSVMSATMPTATSPLVSRTSRRLRPDDDAKTGLSASFCTTSPGCLHARDRTMSRMAVMAIPVPMAAASHGKP
jgi:hypothetical protein